MGRGLNCGRLTRARLLGADVARLDFTGSNSARAVFGSRGSQA